MWDLPSFPIRINGRYARSAFNVSAKDRKGAGKWRRTRKRGVGGNPYVLPGPNQATSKFGHRIFSCQDMGPVLMQLWTAPVVHSCGVATGGMVESAPGMKFKIFLNISNIVYKMQGIGQNLYTKPRHGETERSGKHFRGNKIRFGAEPLFYILQVTHIGLWWAMITFFFFFFSNAEATCCVATFLVHWWFFTTEFSTPLGISTVAWNKCYMLKATCLPKLLYGVWGGWGEICPIDVRSLKYPPGNFLYRILGAVHIFYSTGLALRLL